MMAFLSPLLIWGTLLGAIPLIIHLLNRRRFRRIEWAPMHYLKLTIQRNRRRIQLEQLLLLAPADRPSRALVLLPRPTGAQPDRAGAMARRRRPLEPGRPDRRFAVDGLQAPAMRRPSAVRSKRPLRCWRASVLKTAARCSPRPRHGPRCSTKSKGRAAMSLSAGVASLALGATHAAWSTVLEGVLEVLKSCTYPTKQLTILTDFRRSGWDKSVAGIGQRLSESGVKLRLVDVGADDIANVSLQALVPLDRTILAGTESTWEAVIHNDSSRTLVGAKAVLRVNDKPTELALPEINPHDTARVPLTVRFPGAGPHDVSLQLADDDLPGDNQRFGAASGQGLIAHSLSRWRAVDAAIRLGGRFPGRPLVHRDRRGRGVARRSGARQRLSLPAPRSRPTCSSWPMSRLRLPSRPSAWAGSSRPAWAFMIFTGAKLDLGLYNDLLYRADAPRPAFSTQEPARREHPRLDRRAAASLAASRSCWS